MLDVRVCEEFGILPYLQVTKLACYYSMDAGRTHEASGSETKDCITHSLGSSMSFTFPLPLFTSNPMGVIRRDTVDAAILYQN